MGKVRYLADGEDFGPEHFGSDFGFSGSAAPTKKGPRLRGEQHDDGTYLARCGGGRVKKAQGGAVDEGQSGATVSVLNPDGSEELDKTIRLRINNDAVGHGLQYLRQHPEAHRLMERLNAHGIAQNPYPEQRAQDRATDEEFARDQTRNATAAQPGQDAYANGGMVQRPAVGAMSAGLPGPSPARKRQMGGMPGNGAVPIAEATQAARGAAMIGKAIGQRQGAMMGAPPQAAAPIAQPPVQAAKGGFIKDAIKHPGRMQRGAARAGESTHAYMEEHKHDSGSLGAAARFGLRLTGGDLSPHKKKG